MEKKISIRFKYPIKSIMAIACILFLIVAYLKATAPERKARSQAISLASKYADIDQVKDFYIFNRNRTCYSIYGKSKKGQNLYVITSKDGKKILIFSKDKGVSKEYVEKYVKQNDNPKKIMRIALGMTEGSKAKAVWEVTYLNENSKLCYDLIDFKTGNLVKSIQNL